jgi:hypothetical protein
VDPTQFLVSSLENHKEDWEVESQRHLEDGGYYGEPEEVVVVHRPSGVRLRRRKDSSLVEQWLPRSKRWQPLWGVVALKRLVGDLVNLREAEDRDSLVARLQGTHTDFGDTARALAGVVLDGRTEAALGLCDYLIENYNRSRQ